MKVGVKKLTIYNEKSGAEEGAEAARAAVLPGLPMRVPKLPWVPPPMRVPKLSVP
jgi:hypothetical protein